MHYAFKLLLTAVLFLFFAACSSDESNSASDNAAEAGATENAATQAPDFEVTTIEGRTVSLQQTLQENKPMVVYFTASWCPICAQNWPALSEVYLEYSNRLDFIAIGIDPTDTRDVMTELAEEEGFTFPLTWGHPQIMVDFGVESQATTVGINRDGTIAFQRNKTALSADEYRALFDELVSQ